MSHENLMLSFVLSNVRWLTCLHPNNSSSGQIKSSHPEPQLYSKSIGVIPLVRTHKGGRESSKCVQMRTRRRGVDTLTYIGKADTY